GYFRDRPPARGVQELKEDRRAIEAYSPSECRKGKCSPRHRPTEETFSGTHLSCSLLLVDSSRARELRPEVSWGSAHGTKLNVRPQGEFPRAPCCRRTGGRAECGTCKRCIRASRRRLRCFGAA